MKRGNVQAVSVVCAAVCMLVSTPA